MNAATTILVILGMPMWLALNAVLYLCGKTPESEGFAGLARSIGVAFYCGIATATILVIGLVWLVFRLFA